MESVENEALIDHPQSGLVQLPVQSRSAEKMITDLLVRIKNVALDLAERNRIAFDERIEKFNDDFAKGVSWAPATRGGVGFRTRTMNTSGNEVIRFKPSLTALAVSAGSIAIGFWLIARFAAPGISARHYVYDFFGAMRALYSLLQNQMSLAQMSVALFGLVFVLIGLVCLYKLLRPVRFDRFSREFSKGYPLLRKTSVSFGEIKAIQILQEHCRGRNNNNFTSYELNLVLKNKSRITVVDHSDIAEIRRNGDALSKMLSVPVWDITRNWPQTNESKTN